MCFSLILVWKCLRMHSDNINFFKKILQGVEIHARPWWLKLLAGDVNWRSVDCIGPITSTGDYGSFESQIASWINY